jgi:hypothetical protein
MSKNDKRILELKTKIDVKRNMIGEITKFTPNTNCKYGSVNLRTLDLNGLRLLLIDIHTKLSSAKQLGFGDMTIYGFGLVEWKADLLQLIKLKDQKEQLKDLKEAESKLTVLLSEGKQTELEIDNLEDLLNL